MRRALASSLGAALVGGLVGGVTAFGHHLVLTHPVPAPTGTYTEGVVGPVGILNPLFAEGNENAAALARLVFEGLTRINPGGEVGGALAQEWERSADQKTYRLALQPDVRWADGRPLSAEDVLFSISLVQDPAYPGNLLAGNWRNIQAQAEDSLHVKLILPVANAAFLANAAALPILPRHALSTAAGLELRAHPFNLQPFGTGPFRVARRNGDLITFERSPTARRRPYLEHIVVRSYASDGDAARALRRGEIDGLSEPPLGLAYQLGAARIRMLTAETYRYTTLLFNLKPEVPLLQDRRVRLAIARAIDRTRLVGEAVGGQATVSDGPIPVAISWAVNPQVRAATYDPPGARGLLVEAGWPESAVGAARVNAQDQPLRLSLVVGQEQGPLRAVAQRIADDLGEIGIEVEVVAVRGGDLLRHYLKPRKFELALVAYDNGPDPDVFLYWHSKAPEAGGFNFVSMRPNVFIDRDLEEGRATADRAVRQTAYFDFQRRLAEELPAVFLYSPRFTWAVSRRVQGVMLDSALEPAERFRYVERWYVNTQRARS
jgi:peptide/nickel transport system substrate-binding protein